MNSTLFGSRESYEYPRNYYPNPPYPYGYSGGYPAYYSPHLHRPCPYSNPTLFHGQPHLPSYPYPMISPAQPPAFAYPNTLTYGWGEPRIIIPNRGLETILIAILILVALDLIFVRPRR
ncbi:MULTISPECIES: hypothetical protein [Desulfitobacterium]|uniref:Uncharacterized protein n=1 Tax=Desulfitobacterium dehalogenans (strain ATCC 51507 / DSM 9161 / JW/IU-DC1) TaxID=756499 RepID=I4AB38_DESDJ|nr:MULTISPECIES: hypothetical protein [Desulfitobacterium]AFM01173.1 hypothetical protein Desde_2870 [Desulfitobacterium dehalogenans ATCC 51507]